MLKLDPIWQPDVQQNNFRLLLDAMAYPGRCFTLHGVTNEGHAALSVLATLLDAEVTLSDPYNLLSADNWQMLQSNSISEDKADYVLCDASQSPNFLPKLGTLAEPEQSATLILMVKKIGKGVSKLKLSGPGIKNIEDLIVDGLNSVWLTERDDWVGSFPLGVDMILVDDQCVAALPRTTKVEVV